MEHKKRLITILIMIAVVICAAIFAYSVAAASSEKHERAAVRQAVISSAVQCCSIEGNYPQDISYLEENYGLQIDKSKYIIVYQAIGSNVMPEVTVLEKGK